MNRPSQSCEPFLAQRLPRYMMPGEFLFMDSLPRTPTGKLDYEALPALARGAPDAAHAHPVPHQERLGVDVPPRSIFDAATVSELANAIESAGGSTDLV